MPSYGEVWLLILLLRVSEEDNVEGEDCCLTCDAGTERLSLMVTMDEPPLRLVLARVACGVGSTCASRLSNRTDLS